MSSHWDAIAKNTGKKSICTCNGNPECEGLVNSGNDKFLGFMTRRIFTTINSYREACTFKHQGTTKIEDISDIDQYNYIEDLQKNENNITFYANQMELSEYGSSVARMNRYKYTCSCAGSDSASCKKQLNEVQSLSSDQLYSTNSNCPYPIMKPIEGTDQSQLTHKDEINGMSGGVELKPNGDLLLTEAPRNKINPSLLHPAHFARIKYGSCKDKVKKYSSCAQYAYKRVKKDCPERPKYCEEDESWLLTEQ